MLKHGDIVIMQREDQIGFETKKKTSGRSSKPPKWFKDFVDNDFKPLVKKVDSVIKLNNLKTK